MNRWWRVGTGLLLAALGVAMIVVAITGDSLFYVRDVMTLPLVISGGFVAVLGVATITGTVAVEHAPRSLAFVALAVVFILVVRPGPLSVEAGITFDAEARRVQSHFEIPRDALVGAGASSGSVRDHAIELHAGQIWFGVQQYPDVFDEVAIRMIGQFDITDEGDDVLVRFRITCCAADALRVTIHLAGATGDVQPGDWIEVYGQWDGDVELPGLRVTEVAEIDMPERPYLTRSDD